MFYFIYDTLQELLHRTLVEWCNINIAFFDAKNFDVSNTAGKEKIHVLEGNFHENAIEK